MALLLAGAVAACIAVVALDNGDLPTPLINFVRPPDQERIINKQIEFGLRPSITRLRHNSRAPNASSIRVTTRGELQDVVGVALEYVRHFARGVSDKTSQAFAAQEFPTLGNAPRFKPVLISMHSRDTGGKFADNPFAYFRLKTGSTDIMDDPTIYPDKFSSWFGGPLGDKYPQATAPEPLRNAWALDGRLFRATQMYREPRITSRPLLNDNRTAPQNKLVKMGNQQRKVRFTEKPKVWTAAPPGM